MMRGLFNSAVIATLGAGVCGSASAEWMKSYVIEWYEPAHYYGAKEGVIDPGTDCPKGTNPAPDWTKVLVDAGYTLEEARWLRDPANPNRSPLHGQNQMAFRGKNRANVYVDPTSTPDPGFEAVAGEIGEGLDLDGDPQTGFVSPTGAKGIDNNFYKALGCWHHFRGPPRLSSGGLSYNDSMREGLWTVVIVVTGKGMDPMNDEDVEVGFYLSADKLVKDGAGDIALDYTFRILPDAKYEAILIAKTTNGQIKTTTPAKEIWLPDPGFAREIQLLNARLELQMEPDGSLSGYLGGYRPWEAFYRGAVSNRGPVVESLTWVQLPAVYYALNRHADFSPSGSHGARTHISFAYRIDAIPAFVVRPGGRQEMTAIESFKALAPESSGNPSMFRRSSSIVVTDGIVINPNAKVQAGPNAVILPPNSGIGDPTK